MSAMLVIKIRDNPKAQQWEMAEQRMSLSPPDREVDKCTWDTNGGKSPLGKGHKPRASVFWAEHLLARVMCTKGLARACLVTVAQQIAGHCLEHPHRLRRTLGWAVAARLAGLDAALGPAVC